MIAQFIGRNTVRYAVKRLSFVVIVIITIIYMFHGNTGTYPSSTNLSSLHALHRPFPSSPQLRLSTLHHNLHLIIYNSMISLGAPI